MNNIDIEIREIGPEKATRYQVVVFDLKKSNTGEEERYVRDIFVTDSYQVAVVLLAEFLRSDKIMGTEIPARLPLEENTAASTLDFVELCHDISNSPNEDHQLWLNELTVRCRQFLRSLIA